MPVSHAQIAIIKGMLAYRSEEGKAFRHQDISGLFGINSARVTEIRYGDKGIGVGIEPTPQSKFPEKCWRWPLVRPPRDKRAENLKKKKKKCQDAIEIAEINRKIKPLIRVFKEESSKNITMVALSAIARHAGLLEKCLDEWNKASQPQRRSK